MLTPEIDDANRKNELARMKKEPHTFGVPVLDAKHATPGPTPDNGGLVRAADEEQVSAVDEVAAAKAAEEETARIRTEWEQYLEQSVPALIADLPNVQSREQLATMQVVEEETKNRKTLLEAIAAEIAKRAD